MFGQSLALHNDLLVIGATRRHAEHVDDAGGVYVFTLQQDKWAPSLLIQSRQPRSYAQFGINMLACRTALVIAEPDHATQNRSMNGAIYLVSWTEILSHLEGP